jgi:hypothetical protein
MHLKDYLLKNKEKDLVPHDFLVLKHVDKPDQNVWESNRQSFLNEALKYKDAYTSKIRKSQASALISPTGLKQTLTKERLVMVIALKAVVILTLVFGGTLGTVRAAGGSIPGSVLYPIKMQLENWQLTTAKEPLRQAMLALQFAQNRVDEVEALMNQGDNVPSEVAQRYQEQIKTALKTGDALPEPLKEQMQDRIRTKMEQHLQTMTQLQLRTCQEDCDQDEPLQAMIRLVEQTKTQLALHQGQESEAPAGPPEDSPGKGPGDTEGGNGPGDGTGGDDAPKNNAGDGAGPGEPPEEKPGPGEGNGSENDPPKPGEGGPQGPADGSGDGIPGVEPPGSGAPDSAGDGDQDGDGTCSAEGNCGDGEGDGNNGAGDNGGSDGGEPSGGDNSEGDNSGGDNGGCDNGGGSGNGGK